MMAPSKVLIVSGLLSWSCHIAYADDQNLSERFSGCMDKSDGSTSSMRECIAAETKRQDDRLNKAYKELMAQFAPARKKQLLDAQRAWLKFRDAKYGFYADPNGGTLSKQLADNCFMSSTAARAKELEGFKQ
jgi:uncharacterized protein YecT (DUF1311 family)